MKRFYGFLTLAVLVLFSFNVNAQRQNGRVDVEVTETLGTATCNLYDVEIEITNVELKESEYCSNCHTVYIDFIRPANFTTLNTTEPYTCDITLNLFGISDLPVKLMYGAHPERPVQPVYNAQGELSGFRVFPDNGGGTGIGSTLGVLGRVGNVGDGSNPCVQIISSNRAGENCSLPNSMEVYCQQARMAQTIEAQDVRVYPNPAQNRLFVETNDMEVKEVNVVSLYGQPLNHKASIRYGIDSMQINTTQLESGIYLIILETTNGTVVKKIMIQKD